VLWRFFEHLREVTASLTSLASAMLKLEKVIVTDSSNIHLNAFMCELILDLKMIIYLVFTVKSVA